MATIETPPILHPRHHGGGFIREARSELRFDRLYHPPAAAGTGEERIRGEELSGRLPRIKSFTLHQNDMGHFTLRPGFDVGVDESAAAEYILTYQRPGQS